MIYFDESTNRNNLVLANQTYPLSVVEKRMLALNKRRRTAGFSSRPLKLHGDFCVETFVESYTWLTDKHPVLKTRYELDINSGAYIKVLDGSAVIANQDYSAMGETFVTQKIIELSRADFDIKNDSLFIVHLMKCSEDTFILYIKSHHVHSDGLTCLKILHNTLEAYHALKTTGSCSNTQSDCTPPQYVRFEEEFSTLPADLH